MIGILVAGGIGNRLSPTTTFINKHLIPIYNKPLIYYSISLLIDLGVSKIIIITSVNMMPILEMALIPLKSRWGIDCELYQEKETRGPVSPVTEISEFFDIHEPVCLLYCDNILFGENFYNLAKQATTLQTGALAFYKLHANPNDFGVVEFDEKKSKPIAIIEKPNRNIPSYVIPGLYFFDNRIFTIVSKLKLTTQSPNITQVLNSYLRLGELKMKELSSEDYFFDCGSTDSVLSASQCIKEIEFKTQSLIGSPEYSAYKKGMVSKELLHDYVNSIVSSDYGKKLKNLLGD